MAYAGCASSSSRVRKLLEDLHSSTQSPATVQLYEDNPEALSRDFSLLQASGQISAGANQATAFCAEDLSVPANGERMQHQPSLTGEPLERAAKAEAGADAKPAHEPEAGSATASEATSPAVAAELSHVSSSVHSLAPSPLLSCSAASAPASDSDQLPVRRLHFSSVESDAASRRSGAATVANQEPAPVSGEFIVHDVSSSSQHDPPPTGSAAAKPQKRGRRLWGVWSLLRRGKHADGEQTAPGVVPDPANAYANRLDANMATAPTEPQLLETTAAGRTVASGASASEHVLHGTADSPGAKPAMLGAEPVEPGTVSPSQTPVRVAARDCQCALWFYNTCLTCCP